MLDGQKTARGKRRLMAVMTEKPSHPDDAPKGFDMRATSGSGSNVADEADRIPDWAALAVALGATVAIGGFVSAWFTDNAWAAVALTIGLAIAAAGMTAAERAVCTPPSSLSNA
jgi:hypothetical protein